jgi:hypothetical protein
MAQLSRRLLTLTTGEVWDADGSASSAPAVSEHAVTRLVLEPYVERCGFHIDRFEAFGRWRRACPWWCASRAPGRARRGAVRRLARRHGAGRGRHGAAPQALPHARGSFDLPTPRCTRSSCRTPPRTTALAPPRPWPGSRALDAEDAAGGLFDLAAALGAKLRLAEIGMRASDLDRAADLAVQSLPQPEPAHPRACSTMPSTENGRIHSRVPTISRQSPLALRHLGPRQLLLISLSTTPSPSTIISAPGAGRANDDHMKTGFSLCEVETEVPGYNELTCPQVSLINRPFIDCPDPERYYPAWRRQDHKFQVWEPLISEELRNVLGKLAERLILFAARRRQRPDQRDRQQRDDASLSLAACLPRRAYKGSFVARP